MQQELLAADVDQNNADRLQKYNDAEQKIVNDVGWIPVYQSSENYMQSLKLSSGFKKAYGDSLNTIYPDDWADIYFTQ